MNKMEFVPDRWLGYGRQSISEADIAAVVGTLRGDFLTQGPVVVNFEKAFAEKVGCKHAIAVSNGTAALHLSCMAAGLDAGSKVLTTPITFVATANAARYCGAKVGLVDIDEYTLSLDIEKLSSELSEDVKIVLPVHFAGLASDMRLVREMVGDRIIIEDACHALGGTYEDGSPIGSCLHSDMTVFSFHPVKPITTGEGGMITTNDDRLASKLRELRSHGITKNADEFCSTDVNEIGPWSYEHQTLGYNYRLTDIQAALGLSQLSQLDGFLTRRRELSSKYDIAFWNVKHLKLTQNQREHRERSGHHIYVLRLDFEGLGISRAELMQKLLEQKIGTQVHYIPIQYHPFSFENDGLVKGDFPVSESYYAECLTIPFHVDLTDQEVNYVIDTIKKCLVS